MKEVIDLAFKVISMKYLNLESFPLFLDEFGCKLDEAHRKTAHHAMRELMRASNFSQVFIVSHYEESYASLTDCDITVLSDANLTLPATMNVNEVTTIE